MRLRFSIRTLLVVTALSAVGCYWWIARPTIVARQFIAAVEGGDYTVADAMISPATPAFFERVTTMASVQSPAGWNAALRRRTWDDLWKGRRQIDVSFRGLLEVDKELIWLLPEGPAIATARQIEFVITSNRRRAVF